MTVLGMKMGVYLSKVKRVIHFSFTKKVKLKWIEHNRLFILMLRFYPSLSFLSSWALIPSSIAPISGEERISQLSKDCCKQVWKLQGVLEKISAMSYGKVSWFHCTIDNSYPGISDVHLFFSCHNGFSIWC